MTPNKHVVKLLSEIVEAATDPKIPVAATLRKCLILAFELKNEKLKTWVEAELNGYNKEEEVPQYRKLHLHSKGNFQGPGGAWIPGRPLPMAVLEEKHRKYLDPAILSEPIAFYGWIDGQNVSIEYRFAEGKADAARLAAELVQLRVDAILADSSQATEAAKNATRTIPIVMAVSNDPVASGFVASLGRLGGNITGNSLLSPELTGRRLQLLTDIVPDLARVVVLAISLRRAVFIPAVEAARLQVPQR